MGVPGPAANKTAVTFIRTPKQKQAHRRKPAKPVLENKPRVSGKFGRGAWIRTKIHSSKGWCAALAPRPCKSHIVSQRFVMGNITCASTNRFVVEEWSGCYPDPILICELLQM